MEATEHVVCWWHVALPCLCLLLLWSGTVAARADFRRLHRRLDLIRKELDRNESEPLQ